MSGEPDRVGAWGSILTWPIVAVHAHLLPTGQVLFWDRGNTGTDKTTPWGPPQLWDPRTEDRAPVSTAMLGYEPFCSGHSLLADGRLFVAGGHDGGDYIGQRFASIFDPFSGQWSTVEQPMNAGRWYPTATALAGGDMLVLSGTMDRGLIPGLERHNDLPQVYESATGTWRDLTGARVELPAYPFMYAVPNGKVFMAGPDHETRYLDTAGTGQWTAVARSANGRRDYGSSVMYDSGKVMIVGGSSIRGGILLAPTASAETIDLNQSSASWVSAGSMKHARRQHTATVLPDGAVLVTGGTSHTGFNDPGGAVLEPELWDPRTSSWTTLAPMGEMRLYHSIALLLPDARVLVAGGGLPAGGANDRDHLSAQLYSPPYLFNGQRPVIDRAPESITFGSSFAVDTSDASRIETVRLIRLGSVTHAYNQSQLAVTLSFQAGSGSVEVTAPGAGNVATPGPYMLFLIDDGGVPSEAAIVHLTTHPLCAVTFELDVPQELTQAGERVVVTGQVGGTDGGQLGRGNPRSANALALGRADGSVWRGTRLLPQGASVQYDLAIVGATGDIVEDGAAARSATVPSDEPCAVEIQADFSLSGGGGADLE